MMQMIEAGGIEPVTDNQRVADEDNLRGYYELDAIKKTKEDASWLEDSVGKAAKVIYMLLYDLPADYEYRVVFMNRNLDEVLASQSKMLERRGQDGASVSNEKLKDIFQQQLDKCIDWLADQSSFSVLQIQHLDAIQSPAKVASAVNQFLAGDLDEAKMAAVVQPDLYRQRI